MGGVDVSYCSGICVWGSLRAELSEAGVDIGGNGMDDDVKQYEV